MSLTEQEMTNEESKALIEKWMNIIAEEGLYFAEEYRQAVIKCSTWANDKADVWNRIKALPCVNPQPKTGHWISHYDEDAKEGWYECDRCHTERAFNTDFCPDCGARMIEPQESREKE